MIYYVVVEKEERIDDISGNQNQIIIHGVANLEASAVKFIKIMKHMKSKITIRDSMVKLDNYHRSRSMISNEKFDEDKKEYSFTENFSVAYPPFKNNKWETLAISNHRIFIVPIETEIQFKLNEYDYDIINYLVLHKLKVENLEEFKIDESEEDSPYIDYGEEV